MVLENGGLRGAGSKAILISNWPKDKSTAMLYRKQTTSILTRSSIEQGAFTDQFLKKVMEEDHPSSSSAIRAPASASFRQVRMDDVDDKGGISSRAIPSAPKSYTLVGPENESLSYLVIYTSIGRFTGGKLN